MADPELAVVVPVYNEGHRLTAMLRAWSAELDRLGISFMLGVYDDGSSDDSEVILDRVAPQIPRLHVVRQPNVGHGPTVIRAYRETTSEWIFQVDGDDEIGPGEFTALWSLRGDADLVMGVRRGRSATWVRRMITWWAKWIVRAAYGANAADVNTPYRLMRSSAFKPLLDEISPNFFAPNIALTGMAAMSNLRILEVPVPCSIQPRTRSSLRGFRLWRGVARSLWQTVVVAVRFRRSRKHQTNSRGEV